MTLVDPRLVTDAVRTKLATITIGSPAVPVPVGDAQAPSGVAPPYVVVYPIPGGGTRGTLGDLDGDADLDFQVTCVSKHPGQAQVLEREVEEALVGVGTLTVAGRNVLRVSQEGFGGVRRDDTTSPPLFMAVPRFRVLSTPS